MESSTHPRWSRLVAGGAAVLGAALLGACDGENCGRPICGCWEDVTVTLDITVVDTLGEPLEGIAATCVNEDSDLATSDATGALVSTFDSRLSQACGTERCNTLTLSDPEGRCEGTQSTLLALNRTTVTLTCSEGDDDDSAE